MGQQDRSIEMFAAMDKVLPNLALDIDLSAKWQLLAYEVSEEQECGRPALIDDHALVFGLLMAETVKNGTANSVLWKTGEPQGSEDKTWARTFFALCGWKEYSDVITFTNLDFPHVCHILGEWSKTSIFATIRKYAYAWETNT